MDPSKKQFDPNIQGLQKRSLNILERFKVI